MRIAVLAGGLSPERDVSLSSGSLIANALMENGHSVALVELYAGSDISGGLDGLFLDKKSGRTFSYTVPKTEPDLDALREEIDNGGALIGKNVLDICKYADVTFIALHGSIGENGQLQAMLDVCGVRYTGTGYAGSMMAMDKDIAKRLMRQSGIPTPDWVYLESGGDLDPALLPVGLPCVVKPCGCGSSVGVSLVRDRARLEAAVHDARKHEQSVLLEKLVEGREFSVGVFDGAALPVIEIITDSGFYDYANKYQPGFAKEVCPADISPEDTGLLQRTAIDVHRALRLGFYSRIDFILDKNGCCHCLEANTLPGMTPTSLLPQEAAAAGITYNDLCEKIAAAAAAGNTRR